MINFDYCAPNTGRHTCKVTCYEHVVPEEEGKQDYILVTMLGKDCCTFEARLYAARIPYFMGAIARQTRGATAGIKLSAVLDYLMAHDFDIWVSYDPDYGMQVNYSAPRK